MSRPSSLFSPRVRLGHVLDRDEATAFGEKLLGMVRHRSLGVSIRHVSNAIVKMANNRVISTDEGDELLIRFVSSFGSNIPCTITTNQLNDETLRRVVEQAEAAAAPLPDPSLLEPDDEDDPKYYTYQARDQMKVNLWHDTTAQAMMEARDDAVADMMGMAQSAKVNGAATIGISARSQLFMWQPGLTAYSKETDCEVTMTARQPDGTASGWAGQANRDWAKISPSAVAAQAIEISNMSKGLVGMEPGRKTAILSPAAVAQLLACMPGLFDASQTDRGYTVFSYRDEEEGRMSRLFMKVFDERLQFVSDPQDAEGGFPPFYEYGDIGGIPIPKVTWVDNGVLQNLAYTMSYAKSRGKRWNRPPESVRMQGREGTPLATIEDMIAQCEDGVYVNRFSQVSLLDGKTGMMTGVTRDGCFHIKDGKINKPIKNYRFVDSPMFAFNSLIMIGKPQRVAFGYTRRISRWPRLPIICPPMMIRDFNFSALSEAI